MFNKVSIATSVVSISLCMVLLFVPSVMFMLFDISENSSAIFMGKRLAMLFLCLSIISWVGRNAQHSESRQSICIGLSISLLGLGLLGIYEYIISSAGVGIFLAICIEILLAVLYFRVWLSNRHL